MQTTQVKNRTAVLIGALALAAVVGGVALWSGSKTKAPEVAAVDDLTIPNDTPSATSNMPQTGSMAGTGKTSTPSATSPTSPTTSTPSTTKSVPQTHTVAANQTLYEISRLYYGTHIYAADIEALNQLENPDHITAGTVLKLPKPEEMTKN